MPKFTKPEGTSDADYQKTKSQMSAIFNAAIGISALTDKDYDVARKNLRAAVDSSPDSQKDFSVVYRWLWQLAYFAGKELLRTR